MRSRPDRPTNGGSRWLVWAPIVIHALAASEARAQCASWRPAELGARTDHSMVYDSRRDRAVLIGGFQEFPSNSNTMGDTWEWDGTRWTLRATFGPAPRTNAAAAYDPVRGVTVLFGGVGPEYAFYGDTWEWDGERWRLASTSGPPARSHSAMCFDSGRGVCTLIAGYNGTVNDAFYQDVWEWNGAQWTQRVPENAPNGEILNPAVAYDPVRARVAVWCGDSKWYNWNGARWGLDPAPPGQLWTAPRMLTYDAARGVLTLFTSGRSSPYVPFSVWRWNGVWTQGPLVMPVADLRSAAVYDSTRHKTLVVGSNGLLGPDRALQTTWDGATWTNQSPALPPVLYTVSMVYDSVRRVAVRLGGGSGPGQDTWEFDGERWTLKTQAGPPAMFGHAMAFDRRRGVTVLAGGRVSGGPLNLATWEWDGVAWTQRNIPGPGPRPYTSMAFDEARGVMVLCGSESLADTWEFDGVAWIKRSDGGGPLPAGGAPLVYDPDRQRCVLFGGGFLGYAAWDWDGVAWTLADIDGPRPELRKSIAYDRRRGVYVVYGGSPTSEQWEWDRTSWTRVPISTPFSPGSRTGVGLIYDEARGAILLHGGSKSSDTPNGPVTPSIATWYYGDDLRIARQPEPLALTTGERARFEVGMAGAVGYAYAWSRDGVPMVNGGPVSGADTRALVIDPARVSDRGEYTVEVTLECGAVLSQPAALAVACPGDVNGDGLVNFLDLNIVLGDFGASGPGIPGDIDADGDCDFVDLNILLGAYGVTC